MGEMNKYNIPRKRERGKKVRGEGKRNTQTLPETAVPETKQNLQQQKTTMARTKSSWVKEREKKQNKGNAE